MTHVALTIAGSDSGGGAGIQADLKAFSALGVYGASAITAITAQNTRGVDGVAEIAPDMVEGQIRAVLDDLPVGAVKIGMLSSAAIIEAVAEALAGFQGPVVLDPVMIAKSGDALLRDDAVAALVARLLPRADVLTPNLPEAARLLGADAAPADAAPADAAPADAVPEAGDEDEMIAQGEALVALGPRAVLMKGGHGSGPDCLDFLVAAGAPPIAFRAPRRATKNTHGTGCTLSAAIAAGLAKGHDVARATGEAHEYLQKAIAAANDLAIGGGAGPVHHFHEWWAP